MTLIAWHGGTGGGRPPLVAQQKTPNLWNGRLVTSPYAKVRDWWIWDLCCDWYKLQCHICISCSCRVPFLAVIESIRRWIQVLLPLSIATLDEITKQNKTPKTKPTKQNYHTRWGGPSGVALSKNDLFLPSCDIYPEENGKSWVTWRGAHSTGSSSTS